MADEERPACRTKYAGVSCICHAIRSMRKTSKNQANIYPDSGATPTIVNADKSRPNGAVCFSGGGSRARTCARDQMVGLINSRVVEKVRYISSVSGGTWTSSIFTFLLDTITDADLLGQYVPPENLSLNNGSGKLNVNNHTGRSSARGSLSVLICT